MACRGVHLGLTADQVTEALAKGGGEDLMEHLFDLEEKVVDFREQEGEVYWQETDKAWDAIHRCLGAFPPDTPYFYDQGEEEGAWADPAEHGSYPLKLAVLGGRRIYTDNRDYLVHLVEPKEVKDIAAAMAPLDKAWLRAKYFHHCAGAWPEYSEEDFEYTWEWFDLLREFYQRMAKDGRAVIFSVDQ